MGRYIEESSSSAAPLSDIEIRPSALAGYIILFISIAAAGFFLWLLIRWLFSRTEMTQEKNGFGAICRRYFIHWLNVLLNLIKRVVRNNKNLEDATLFFRRLTDWGARSGLPRKRNETPNAYGGRLSVFFPAFAPEIEMIIEMFNRSKYGHAHITDAQMSHLHAGWKKLRSPRLWLPRLKLLLFDESKSRIEDLR